MPDIINAPLNLTPVTDWLNVYADLVGELGALRVEPSPAIATCRETDADGCVTGEVAVVFTAVDVMGELQPARTEPGYVTSVHRTQLDDPATRSMLVREATVLQREHWAELILAGHRVPQAATNV